MRRLARHAFTAFAALSLLLCLAVCVLWVRSYPHGQDLYEHWAEGFYGSTFVNSRRGSLNLIHYPRVGDAGENEHGLDLLGLTLSAGDGLSRGAGVYHYALDIRYWVLFALTAAPPLWWAVGRLLSRRGGAVRGLCPACGYDLRATPDRCPECGADGTRAAAG